MSEESERRESPDPAGTSRRDFLTRIGGGACAVAGAGSLVVTLDFLKPKVLFEPPTIFRAGSALDYPDGTVRFNREQRAYVIGGGGGVFALSAVCTHLGCITRYLSDEKAIACPCHGSRFDLEGNVVHGPAPRALPWLEVTADAAGNLVVDSSIVIPARKGDPGMSAARTSIADWLRGSAVYRSIVRHGTADTNRNRSLVIFENLFLHVHPVKVREKTLRFSHTYWLGGVTLVSSLVLIATGILLMFYYHPSVPQAYRDMKELNYVVDNGLFLRNLHRWAAHLMVFGAFLHMLRVFYHRAYRPPRQFNWVVGIVLLIITLFLSYTGYLLPWDQLAFWGVSVGTNMAKEAPLVGEKIRFLLLGGNVVSENALLRFYVLHCVVLPVALLLFLSVHIWRIRKDGGVQGPPADADDPRHEEAP